MWSQVFLEKSITSPVSLLMVRICECKSNMSKLAKESSAKKAQKHIDSLYKHL